MSLIEKIMLLGVLWDDIQGELFRLGGIDERVMEASDDITFAVASLKIINLKKQ